jgi:transcriptional regulator with XRE-family HTH domain
VSVAIGSADEIGEFVKELRLESGLTQVQLAERMGGITYNAISMIERGHSVPRLRTLLSIAKACDVELWLTAEIPPDQERTPRSEVVEVRAEAPASKVAPVPEAKSKRPPMACQQCNTPAVGTSGGFLYCAEHLP